LDYIFFSSHILVVAFQVPPAFAQSASVFARGDLNEEGR
jgi:hypothetical protein